MIANFCSPNPLGFLFTQLLPTQNLAYPTLFSSVQPSAISRDRSLSQARILLVSLVRLVLPCKWKVPLEWP